MQTDQTRQGTFPFFEFFACPLLAGAPDVYAYVRLKGTKTRLAFFTGDPLALFSEYITLQEVRKDDALILYAAYISEIDNRMINE